MYKYFIGCDTRKKTHHISIMDITGQLAESFEIENSPIGFNEALESTKVYVMRVWGIENSANYAKSFRKHLFDRGETMKEVNPVFTSRKRAKHTRK